MTKATSNDARPTKSATGSRLQRAVANLDQEISNSAAADGTAGHLDSPLLIAVANTLTAYVAWRLEMGGR